MIVLDQRNVSETTNTVNTDQNELINVLRLVFCFLVVGGHVHSNTPSANYCDFIINLFCVPFFLSVALFFFTKNLEKKSSLVLNLKNSWLRIGIPFIAWSSVYLILLFVKHTITGSGQPMTIFSVVRAYLYGESAEHLYYLPELIIMQVIIIGIFTISKNKESVTSWFLLFLSALYFSWGYVHNYYGVTPLAGLVVYILCAFLLNVNPKGLQNRKIYFLTGILLLTIIITYPDLFFSSYRLPISGIGLLLIALSIRSFPIPIWLQLTASATYGIYLSHVLFLEAFEFIIEKTHTHLFYTLPIKLSVTLFIFLLSLVFTLTIRKIPLFRVVFLGEKRKTRSVLTS